jgi:hypothetical protein
LYFQTEIEAYLTNTRGLKKKFGKVPDFWSFMIGKERIATHAEVESLEEETNTSFGSLFSWIFEMVHLERLSRERMDMLKEDLIMAIMTASKEAKNIRTRESLKG